MFQRKKGAEKLQNEPETIQLHDDERDNRRKVRITQLGCWIFAAVCLWCVFLNLMEHKFLMVATNGSLLFCMLLCLVILHRTSKVEKVAWIIAVFAAALVTIYAVTGGSEGTAVLWVLVLPPYAYFVMGQKNASLVCGGLLLELILLMWTPLNQWIYPYSEVFLNRFPLLYGVQTIGTFFIKFQLDRAEQRRNEMLELAIQYKNEAERQSQVKSDFLSRMSHEIRTPLNTIVGMNEMVLRSSDMADVSEYAYKIQYSSEMLLAMINDVLDISKIEDGDVELAEEDYDVFSLLSACYRVNIQRAESKGLSLVLHCDEHLPAMLSGDVTRVRQIALNLISNAIKYTRSGRVEVELSGERHNDWLELQLVVYDTGIGMTQEHLKKLYGKFERFDLNKNQTIEGTGVGMSIVKKLVDLMNGQIEVQSEYGEGTMVTVTLPQRIVNDAEVGTFVLNGEPVREPTPRRCFTAPSARILAVDDIQMNLDVVENLLSHLQIKMDCVTGGKQCMELVRQHKYDLIFMDHMMPEMSGIDTLHAIRDSKDHKNRETPVVVFTANALPGEKERYLHIGFTDYLSKPVYADKLEAMVLKYLPAEKIVFEDVAI